jgi:hypothetical protein
MSHPVFEPGPRPTLNPLREPALLIAALLAPTVQTALLIWAGLSDEEQAVWNAVAAALGGIALAALCAKDRLAPAITGLATAVLSIASYYGWGLTAEQSTAVMSMVSLATGLFLRTQITAPVDADGRRVLPAADDEERDVEKLWPYDFYEDRDREAGGPEPAAADDHAGYYYDDGGPVHDGDTAGLPVPDEAPVDPPSARQIGHVEGRRMAG